MPSFSAIARSVMISAIREVPNLAVLPRFSAIARSVMISAALLMMTRFLVIVSVL